MTVLPSQDSTTLYQLARAALGVPPLSVRSIFPSDAAASRRSLFYGRFPSRETIARTSLAKWWLDDRLWRCDR